MKADRRELIRLRGQHAALVAALAALTHTYEPTPHDTCEACSRPEIHTSHLTPARLLDNWSDP